MANSFTNKNSSLANYNALTTFNGFYTNIYKEPFTTGFAFVFVTKPQLFIDPIKPSSSKDYSRKMAYLNMTRDPVFTQFIDSETMNEQDSRIVKMLSYNNDYNTSNFLPIFTNEVKSFDSSDITMDQTDAFDTKQGYRLPMPTNKTASEAANSLTLSVNEDSNLTFTKMMMLWVNYISNITDGTFDANPEMIKNGELDYTNSIYYFVVGPDGKTLKYWAKYTGCWPTAIPYSIMKYSKGSNELGELDIPFTYTVKEDMNPKILEDFNRVSLKIIDIYSYVPDVAINGTSFNGEYVPLNENPLLNETKLREKYNPVTTLEDPDRSPVVLYKEEKQGDGLDPVPAHFELVFGDNGYKSPYLEEIFNKELDEKTATGYWESEE